MHICRDSYERFCSSKNDTNKEIYEIYEPANDSKTNI